MEKAEYKITLIPISGGGKVMFEGKEYTTAAKTHNVVIEGVTYFIRENDDGKIKQLREIVENNLSQLVKSTVGGGRLGSPLIISLALESDEIA